MPIQGQLSLYPPYKALMILRGNRAHVVHGRRCIAQAGTIVPAFGLLRLRLRDTICDTQQPRMKLRRLQPRTRRPCTICRVRFWAVRRDARFCSPRCRQRAARANRE
jgi:hypothetical protein